MSKLKCINCGSENIKKLSIKILNKKYQEIKEQITDLEATSTHKTSKLPEGNMFVAVRLLTTLVQVLLIMGIYFQFERFVHLVFPDMDSNVGGSTLGFYYIGWGMFLNSYTLLAVSFLIAFIIRKLISYKREKRKNYFQAELEKLKSSLQETIVFIIFLLVCLTVSFLWWTDWSFNKVLVSILFLAFMIEIPCICLSFRTAVFLPYLRKRTNQIMEKEYLKGAKQELAKAIKEKQTIWSSFYYCFDCNKIMDLESQLYDKIENLYYLINRLYN
ncbi:MAG: hypothetical protein ABEI32_16005 [Halothece sp.]